MKNYPIRLALACCAVSFLNAALPAQTLYDLEAIQTVEVFFHQSNWDYQLDTARAGTDSYILADSVRINGLRFDSVGVKYKGNSSYDAANAKNPLHLELDHVRKGADYEGHTDLKLGNGFADPSLLREPFSYKILRNYMNAPQCNFAKVYINGTYWGLYSNVESVTKEFISQYDYPAGNAFFKCNPEFNGAGPSGTSNLDYLGADSSDYYDRYELKSDYGWKDLIDLCDTLENHSAAIDRILDVDKAIWMIAFNNVLVNLDSYTGTFVQNYYLYRDGNQRFASVIWDLNMCFGGFPLSGTGQPLNLTGLQQFSPVFGANLAARPLIKQLLANPTYRRMYFAHLRTITAENFANTSYITEAQNLMALIDAAVQADTKKFYTYTQFQNSLSQGVSGAGFFNTPGIQQLMDARVAFLQSDAEFQKIPPVVTDVTLATQPVLGLPVTLTAKVSGASSVMLAYRAKRNDRFTYLAMADDGQHGDGAAGDGTYGASIPVEKNKTDYFVYAENADAGIFSPQRAEHEFYEFSAFTPVLLPGEVVINEFLTANTTTNQDPAGQFDDWIEFYNNSSVELNLSGAFLTDDWANPKKWVFPAGTSIGPKSYLLVWCDEDGSQQGLHANFKLGSDGEKLAFFDASGDVRLDSFDYPGQVNDVSMARCPDGVGAFSFYAPTPGAQNCTTATGEAAGAGSFVLSPNPAGAFFSVKNESVGGGFQVELLDLTGRVALSKTVVSEEKIALEGLPPGAWLVRITESQASGSRISRSTLLKL